MWIKIAAHKHKGLIGIIKVMLELFSFRWLRCLFRKDVAIKTSRKIPGSYHLHKPPWTTKSCVFRDMGAYILYKEKRKTEQTKESIITAAAKLIKAELRDLDEMNKVYLTFDELSSIADQKEWIPENLQLLLSYLIPSELKQVLLLKRDFADKNLTLKKITEENL